MEIRENVPLGPLTTIGIGGPARYFVRATTVDEVRDALDWAKRGNHPVLVLAGGSNVLIADEGYDGLVIHINLRGTTVESLDDFAIVKVSAGQSWDGFVEMAVDRGWAGLECLSGIPGLTGATPIQNVGAYGQEVSETIVRVEVLDRESGAVCTFTRDECRFGYRSSIFKEEAKDRYVVLSVTFRLEVGGKASIRYPELQRHLDEMGASIADLPTVRQSVIAIRKRKGMVIDPADPDTRSDGSFFMNPIITARDFESFRGREGAANAPNFPADGNVKLSAGWLIENAGFRKGHVHGNVGLSSKHSLAIINCGGGTAREVVELVQDIQRGVRERFGVEIHPEPNFIGFG